MRRATLACASFLLIAGLTASCGDDDSKDDSKAEGTTSASPSEDASASDDSSDPTEESESPSAEESESPSADPSTDPSSGSGDADTATYCVAAQAASDAQNVEDLKEAVDDLEANLPESASAEVESGLAYLKDALATAKDQEEFVNEVQKGDEKEQAAVKAYGAFEDETCPE